MRVPLDEKSPHKLRRLFEDAQKWATCSCEILIILF